MANPVVSASLNKSTYTPGETAILTVDYSDADNTSYAVTVTVTDATGASGVATVTLVKNDTLTKTVTDSTGGTWTLVSDNGTRAVYNKVV